LPFWSPDGRSLAYFAEGKLMRVEVESGTPVVVCEATHPDGGAWGRDGKIVFAHGSLFRVAATGGKPEEFLPLGPDEEAYRWPSFLPDGRHFVFLRDAFRTPDHWLKLGSIDSDRVQDVIQVVSNACVTASGELVYVRGGALLAQRFDLEQLAAIGEPSTLAEHIVSLDDNHKFEFSVSDTGVLICRSVASESQLTWFDRTGKRLATVGEAAPIPSFDLSPDGTRVAFDMLDADGRLSDLWLLDLVRGQTSRFTFDHAINNTPRWSCDGKRVAFVCSRHDHGEIHLRSADPPHKEDLLLSADDRISPMCGLPDGSVLASVRGKMMTLSLGKKMGAVETTAPDELDARISRDGHWLAHLSNESGHAEIYVESFPDLAGDQRVSSAGGKDPHWRSDGKELYFSDMSGAVIYAAKIETSPELTVSAPTELFRVPGANGFAPSPDGQRFLVNVGADDAMTSPLTVLLDWTAAIRR
jgi:Tol biopolymer transport system component